MAAAALRKGACGSSLLLAATGNSYNLDSAANAWKD